MAGESQQVPEGSPDPSVLTTEQMLREVKNEREWAVAQFDVLRQRLDAMDRATELLNDQMTQVPTDVDKQVGNLKELHSERFDSVGKQFLERDERSARESRDNKVAVDAAFAAQKEAAAKQDESNEKSILKSEKATSETLGKLQDLVKATTDALGDKIDDIRAQATKTEAALVARVAAIEQVVNGYGANKEGATAAWGYLVAAVALAGTVIAIVVGLKK